MRFREQQEHARAATHWLVVLFALTVLLTVLGVNAALALVWRLQFGLFAYPRWFFETNTTVVLGFVLGGWWLEALQLREGGARVAALLGGREVEAPGTVQERRLQNIVQELAIASGLPAPRIFVLDGESAIDAFAAGWQPQDSIIAVSRGALERLTRDELAGVVAHELAHIAGGDTSLNMRLVGMVSGLQLVSDLGRGLMQPVDGHGRRGPTWLLGAALAAAGGVGWLAARLLKAGVSREREFLADAAAVQFTREPTGIGNALRKIETQAKRGEGLRHVNADLLSPLLFADEAGAAQRWLATHPPLSERVRRLFGREMPPLPDDPIEMAEDEEPVPLPPLQYTPVPLPIPVAIVAAGEPAAPAAGADDLALLCETAGLPEALESALLAFFEPPPAAASPERPAAAVRSLGERARLPWFERLATAASVLPRGRRQLLLREARALVQADGRVSLAGLLTIRVLQRLLEPGAAAVPPEAEHLALADASDAIATVTLDLASVLSHDQRGGWLDAATRALSLPAPPSAREAAPALNASLDRLALLARPHRPALVKAWLAAAPAPLPRAFADAMRCVCVLIDTPLPAPLAASFDEPAARELHPA